MNQTVTIRKEFLRYTILNVLGMIGLSCYILADTFFISKGLGANGLAALNLAIPVYSFIHGCGLMLGMGSATRYSVLQGQRSSHPDGVSPSQKQPGFKEAGTVFRHTLQMLAGFAVLFVLSGAFYSEKIASLLGANQEIYAMTRTYLQVILLFSPAFLLNEVLICFVRNDGNPKLSMLGMLLGSLSNIVLDYLFIFPLNLGILGAVLATGFAPLISMSILSLHWLSHKNSPALALHLPFFRTAFWAKKSGYRKCSCQSLVFPPFPDGTDTLAGLSFPYFRGCLRRCYDCI